MLFSFRLYIFFSSFTLLLLLLLCFCNSIRFVFHAIQYINALLLCLFFVIFQLYCFTFYLSVGSRVDLFCNRFEKPIYMLFKYIFAFFFLSFLATSFISFTISFIILIILQVSHTYTKWTPFGSAFGHNSF